jgi:hypothetical protein
MKKNYRPLFTRYTVELRETNSTVYHPYKGSKELTPLQFALFETAIKAIDAHYQALIRTNYVPKSPANTVNIVVSLDGASNPDSEAEWLASYEHARRWHREIAERHGFTLEKLDLPPEAAYADYLYCCKQLGPLYYDLLD